MSLGQNREVEVIAEFSALLKPYFNEVNIVQYPDRLPPTERQISELTTDGLIQLVAQDEQTGSDERKEQLIAVDVMVLALNRENLVAGDFHDVLDPIAHEIGVSIRLIAHSAVFRCEFSEAQADLVQAIRSSPISGTFEIRPGISFTWSKSCLA